jgi:hypothetical protein
MERPQENMSYSKAHQRFSTIIRHSAGLTSPQDFLGPNYETVLNFWWTMDSLTETQWNEVARRYDALDYAAGSAAGDAARSAARDAACYAARSAAWSAAWSAARYAAGYAAGSATYELMGMHTLLNDGKTLLFVPLFDFTKEETKEEPPPHRMMEMRMPTGEIFNIQEMRHMFISTPTNALGGLQSFMRMQR